MGLTVLGIYAVDALIIHRVRNMKRVDSECGTQNNVNISLRSPCNDQQMQITAPTEIIQNSYDCTNEKALTM